MGSGGSVCFVIAALGVGGAERQLQQYLQRRPPDLAVSIVYFNDMYDQTPQSMLSAFRGLNIDIQYIPLKRASIGGLLRLIKYFRTIRPAVVHSFLAGSPATWGRLAALIAGVPVIFQSDRSLDPPVSRVARSLRPFLDRFTSRFMTNADAIAEWLCTLGIKADRIRVVHNGVDLSRFLVNDMPDMRAEWGIQRSALVAGFLGKFRPEKRLDILVDSILALPEEKRPNYLVFGGDGPLNAWLTQRINEDLWLQRHCRIVGLVDDVPRFMCSIDYLVLCSDREGLPNVVLEAMAVGRPIVATRVSDVPTILGRAGFVVDPGDVTGLATAIECMNSLPVETRRSMGMVGWQRVQDEFNLDRNAALFWQCHREVM